MQITVLTAGWVQIPLLSVRHPITAHQIYQRNAEQLAIAEGQLLQFFSTGTYYALLVNKNGHYALEVDTNVPILSKSVKPNVQIDFALGGNQALMRLLGYPKPLLCSGKRYESAGLDSKQIQIARAYYPPTNNRRIEWSAEEPIIGNTSPSP